MKLIGVDGRAGKKLFGKADVCAVEVTRYGCYALVLSFGKAPQIRLELQNRRL